MKRFILYITAVTLALSSALARPYSWSELKALLVFAPHPEYPYNLRQMQMTGSGMFRVFFDEGGKVTEVKALESTGHPELDAEAIKGLMRWKARPGAKCEGDVPITFTLSSPSSTLTDSLPALGPQVHIGPPFVVIGRPVGNGQIELTFYRDNKAVKTRNVKMTSESKLQLIAAGIVAHELLPRVGLDMSISTNVSRAGWIDGKYVMVVEYGGYEGGAHY